VLSLNDRNPQDPSLGSSWVSPCMREADKLRSCGYIGRADYSYLALKLSSQEGQEGPLMEARGKSCERHRLGVEGTLALASPAEQFTSAPQETERTV